MPRVYRANGLAPPYTSTQIFAFSGYIACTGLFYKLHYPWVFVDRSIVQNNHASRLILFISP